MFDLYPAYKPLRNFMSGLPAWPTLVTLWGYYHHVVGREPLLHGLAIGKPTSISLRKHLYAWDLEVLVREVILNGAKTGHRDLARWKDLASAVNHIRDLESAPYKQVNSAPDVFLDLHRISHRQFRWQFGRIDSSTVIRLMKIFGEEALDSSLQSNTGLGINQLLRLGMAVGGGLINRWDVNTGQDYSSVGIDYDASSELLNRLTSDLPVLREKTRATQRYDETWLYAWSPLEAQPLIRLPDGPPHHAICPIPQYLFARLTTGVFYDIVNTPGFANPYGEAFQRYVGEVIAVTVAGGGFKVFEEQPYADGKARLKHGTDWVVSDGTGHLFMECKTKRMSVGSKTVTDPASVEADLAAMAKAIVQNYKNIRDAQNGLTKWVPDGLPVYPIVVTLEDWYLQSSRLTTPLNEQVRALLVAANLDPSLLNTMPYSIMAVAELERALQIVALRGVHPVFGPKIDAPLNRWAMITYLQQFFQAELAQVRSVLFPADAQRLFPEFNIDEDGLKQ